MLPFFANIYENIIRGPNWDLILVILGAQGGGAKIKNLFEENFKISCIYVVLISVILEAQGRGGGQKLRHYLK